MSDLHSVKVRMTARGVTFQLVARGHVHQRRITYQQAAGMIARLRADGDAQVPGVPSIDYGLVLTAAPCGGLGVALTGHGAPVIGRASMSDLDRVESAMGRVAA